MAVATEKCFVFLAKGLFTMMFLLVENVVDRVFDTRNANAKGAESFLPREVRRAEGWIVFPKPFGRVALEKLHNLGNRHGGRQAHQEMDVVGDAADGESLDAVVARNATQIRPEAFADFRGKARVTVPGGEDAMDEARSEGVHGEGRKGFGLGTRVG